MTRRDINDDKVVESFRRGYRPVLVIEGNNDNDTDTNTGHQWLPYHTRYYPTRVARPLTRFAPHQPRIDHNLFYEVRWPSLISCWKVMSHLMLIF
jgi:hypothetical protein